jgi:hypothetical protein
MGWEVVDWIDLAQDKTKHCKLILNAILENFKKNH